MPFGDPFGYAPMRNIFAQALRGPGVVDQAFGMSQPRQPVGIAPTRRMGALPRRTPASRARPSNFRRPSFPTFQAPIPGMPTNIDRGELLRRILQGAGTLG